MLGQTLLVQLLLLVSAAHAFFPYFPCYREENKDTCPPKKTAKPRSSSVTVASRGVGVTGVPRKVKKADSRSHGSSNRERAVAAVGTDSEGVAFRLFRKAPNVSGGVGRLSVSDYGCLHFALQEDFTKAANVARIAGRLQRKYASRARPTDAERMESGVEKRENQYTVVPAATPDSPNAVGIDQDGTDFSYFIQVAFGSSKKILYMLLDTGAGTTWVMGSSCASEACALHTSYGAADSTTFRPNDKSFSIAYGSGSVSGTLATDSLAVAGIKLDLLFGVANNTSPDFKHFPFDGILGMSMNQGATQNFNQALQASKALSSNIFSVALSRSADGPNNGEVMFGGTNPAMFVGDITYTATSPSARGDWAIPLDDISYDGKKAGIVGRNAFIDTGTSYVFGPAADVALLHKLIPGATTLDGVTYTIPCTGSLPSIKITFSGVSYDVSPRDWVGPPSAGGMCTSNIYGQEVVKDAWLMGDLFLKNVYAVFDIDKARIG